MNNLPAPEHIDISVIIVNYNTKDLTIQCLNSVFRQKSVKVEVIVVDNSSSDDSVSAIKKLYPHILLLENKKNLGFARANNQAIERSQGKFVLLLNSDTVLPEDDALFKMFQFLLNNPRVGIAGGKILKQGGTLDWPCKRSFQTPPIFFYRSLKLDKFFPHSKRFGKYHLTYLNEDEQHEVDAITGAFFMIRRETIQEIGLLDENLFMYSEDMDWCYRAKEHGWKVYYYPEVKVLHYKSESSKKKSYQMIYWWYYSTWYVYKKHTAQKYNFLINYLVLLGFSFMYVLSMLGNVMKSSHSIPSRK